MHRSIDVLTKRDGCAYIVEKIRVWTQFHVKPSYELRSVANLRVGMRDVILGKWSSCVMHHRRNFASIKWASVNDNCEVALLYTTHRVVFSKKGGRLLLATVALAIRSLTITLSGVCPLVIAYSLDL